MEKDDIITNEKESEQAVEEPIVEVVEATEETIEETTESDSLYDDLLSDTGTEQIMSDINQKKANESKIDKKAAKKKKKSKKQKHLYSAIIISVTVGIACGGLGLVGGYFLYTLTKPEIEYNVESSDLRSIKKRGDQSTDLLKTFESDPYNLVNYAQLKYAEKETTFTIYNNVAQNISGNQDTHTITINQGERTFLQTHSSSAEGAIVNIRSALRFYDEHDETVTAYEYNEQEQWTADAEPTKYYTYDEYMLKYGKLNQGLYVIDEDLNYLTSDTTVEEGEWMSGVIIHQITKKSVKDIVVKPLDDGKTEINMVLFTNRACYYECRSIKANGGFSKNPTFTETLTLSVTLDENFDLYESKSHETYTVNVGIEADVTTNAITRYYHSEDNNLTVAGHKVKIPEMGEPLTMVINLEGEITL